METQAPIKTTMSADKHCLGDFLSGLMEYKDRANRIEYFSLSVLTYLSLIITDYSLWFIRDVFELTNRFIIFSLSTLTAAISIFLSIRMIFLLVRRLHDIGLSAYYLILYGVLYFLLDKVGLFLLELGLMLIPGISGMNKFGPQPAKADKKHYYVTITTLSIVLFIIVAFIVLGIVFSILDIFK